MTARRRAARRVLGAVGTAVSTVALLAGCSLFPAPDRTSTPVPQDVPDGLEEYYSQQLVWSECGRGFDCVTAQAPLDWDAPTAHPDVELALIRHHATGERQGSLFVNPGGPGASGYDFVANSLDYAVGDDIQAAYDVIGWDPRGVGRSSAVDCLDDAELDAFLFGMPENEVGTPEYQDEVTAQAEAFVDGCVQNSGELLAFIDTDSTVRDLDMLRAIVGDESLNYLGYSYGSDIGAKYIDRFPERVGRMVVDGATDPSVSRFDVSLAQSRAFGEALRSYLADCLEGTQCPFTGTVDDAIDQIDDTLDRLDVSPLRGADGRELTSVYLGTAITSALYDEGTWAYLSTAFDEVSRGQSDTAFLLADSYVGRDEDGAYASNFFQAFIAISCVDYPVERDPAVLAAQAQELAAVDPLHDDGDEIDVLGDTVCQQWPYAFDGTIGPVRGAGAAPVLVVGTTGDPATPYEWAVALSEQLESARLLTYEGEGHTAYPSGNPCIVSAVGEYFVSGTLPADGLVCRS